MAGLCRSDTARLFAYPAILPLARRSVPCSIVYRTFDSTVQMMMATKRKTRDTGLARGDAAKIARIHKVSHQHVVAVACGDRPGRAALVQTIAQYQQRASLTRRA